ncbi:MAG: peptidase M41, partial [Flavobacterium sp.]|nr:peptidase M41 [Flavobacterium sp.]
MSKDKKPNPSKIRISPWVIYGAVLLILIAIQLVSSGTNFQEVKPTSLSRFYQYLDSGQVEKVVFNKSTAQVYLNKEALNSKTHEKIEKKNLLGKDNTGPHYTLD